jgi:hypothetical protein
MCMLQIGNNSESHGCSIKTFELSSKQVIIQDSEESWNNVPIWNLLYERKTSFRPRESRNLGNWDLGQGYAKSLDNDGIMKF